MRGARDLLPAGLVLIGLMVLAAPSLGGAPKCVPETGVDFEKFKKAQSAAIGVHGIYWLPISVTGSVADVVR